MKLNNEKSSMEEKKSEYAVDIKRLPDFQLLEVFERQSKIIKNKSLLNKLSDKGLKLIEKNKAIEFELEIRKKAIDDVIMSISELKIKPESDLVPAKPVVDGGHASLSSSCSSLSQDQDGSNTLIDNIEKFAMSRNNKFDHIDQATRFLPNKPIKIAESKNKFEDKDISAACLPDSKFNLKQVPLVEVVKLKGRETLHIRELEIQEAKEILTNLEFNSSQLTNLSYTPMNYRDIKHESEDEEHGEEDLGLVDDDEDDRKGTITFSVQD